MSQESLPAERPSIETIISWFTERGVQFEVQHGAQNPVEELAKVQQAFAEKEEILDQLKGYRFFCNGYHLFISKPEDAKPIARISLVDNEMAPQKKLDPILIAQYLEAFPTIIQLNKDLQDYIHIQVNYANRWQYAVGEYFYDMEAVGVSVWIHNTDEPLPGNEHIKFGYKLNNTKPLRELILGRIAKLLPGNRGVPDDTLIISDGTPEQILVSIRQAIEKAKEQSKTPTDPSAPVTPDDPATRRQ